MEIAVICAHMDDESFLAGTIARYNIEGHNIHVLILTESCSAGHRDVELIPSPQGTVVERIIGKKAEFLAAMEILGNYKSWKILDFPDMKLDQISHIDLNTAIENFIDKIQPEVVFTHYPGDINKDHRLTYESVMIATRPVPGCPVKKVLCCEIPGGNEWWYHATHPFIPNIYVDISTTLQKKLEAMEEYQSEIREYPHPRSILSIEHLAHVRGAAVGLEAAEAFQLVRSIE